jgi:hypothetical protein
MTRPNAARRCARLSVARLEDRTAPALFGPIDNAVNVGTQPQSVAMADFNGDGKQDMAVANLNGNQLSVLLGSGGAGFSSAAGSPIAINRPYFVAAGDFNGDGRPDLAVANNFGAGGTVTVLLGNGSGGFSQTVVGNGDSLISVAVGDFNGDGKQDLAATNNVSNGTVTVLLGDGGGGFSPAAGSPFAAGNGPRSVVVGDLNGDGNKDLAVTNFGSNDVTVLLGTGTGAFSPAAGSPFAVGANPNYLAVGDLNGDGHPDLAVPNYGDSTLTILLGDGVGGFNSSAGSPIAMVSNPSSVAVGDMNGDGKPDLVVTNHTSNSLVVLLGRGDGSFSPAAGSPVPTGSGPYFAAVGDLNGDGLPDLATANYLGNNVTISLNHGRTTTGVASSASQAVYGQAVVFTATVRADSGLAPTGTVTFRDGAAVLGTAAVSGGTASITFGGSTPLAAGSYAVTATFDSDAFYRGTSAPLTQVVAQAATTTTVIGPATAPAAGQPTELTAVVTGMVAGTLDGLVEFRDGGSLLGTAALVNGVARLPINFYQSGGHEGIFAHYLGNANYRDSTSAATTVMVVGTARKFATGAGPGAPPLVNVYNLDGTLDRSFLAYGAAFRGGVRVATGDVTGDGIEDIITAPGAGGGPLVRVYNGATGTEVRAFYAYTPAFLGGVFVAAGDVNGDGRADIITGPGGTSTKVRVFSGRTGAELFNFLAYPATFKGGVRVAAGDVTGDSKADVIVGPGKGPAQKVRVMDLNAGGPPAEAFSFLPYGPKFTGGVYVAAGRVDQDGKADVIVSPGSGPANVQVVSGATQAVIQSFAAFDLTFLGGASVAAEDVDGDGQADIIAGPGKGLAGHVKVFSGKDPATELRNFVAYDPSSTVGVFVG